MTDQSTFKLLDGYTHEDQMAAARGVTTRTLRAERQRGDGPPWTRMGKTILYENQAFRDWLKANERRPVRAGRAA